ncbi:MAG: retropepsin-like domain-containing protein [Planctomycetes bacterium]|nr:retropepsin-like domain-containing protein [Planctomycetota bacterium]
MRAGAWRPGAAAACGALALLAAGACQSARPRPTQAHEFLTGATQALAQGDVRRADEVLTRGRVRHPEDGALLLWSALVADMRGRGAEAAEHLRVASRATLPEGLDAAEVRGRLGELLFRYGHYTESLPHLLAGAVGPEAERRRALRALALRLPDLRREPEDLAAELPLVPGPLPQLLCRSGDKERPFLLDTGATYTTVTRSAAAELGVTPVVAAGEVRDGSGRLFPVQMGLLPAFSLGQVELGAQPVLVVEDERLGLRDLAGGPAVATAGVVGLDVLGRFRITLDPERRSLAFALERGSMPRDAVEVVRAHGCLLVPVRIEGRTLWFVLDSGANLSSLTAEGLRILPGGESRAGAAFLRVRTPGGTGVAVRAVHGVTLQVGATRFAVVDLPVVEREFPSGFPVHGVLGADLLMTVRVTLGGGRLVLS